MHDEIPVLRRQRDGVFMVGPLRLIFENLHGGIDMALDEMSAESGVRPHGTFQIDDPAGLQSAQVCDLESFRQQIKGALPGTELDDRQAATIDRDALAKRQLCAKGNISKAEPALLLRDNRGGGFNDSGKHGIKVAALEGRIKATFPALQP